MDGLEVDKASAKTDCQSCTEAKQTTKSYPQHATHRSKEPGKLTHIDMWGKFDKISIEGYQYFLGLTDDHSRHVTVEGLKKKSEAAQKVKDYISYLKTHGKHPEAVRFNVGGEFIAKDL